MNNFSHQLEQASSDPIKAYETARDICAGRNSIDWNELYSRTYAVFNGNMAKWNTSYSKVATDYDSRKEAIAAAITCLAPLLTVSLVGVMSKQNDFMNRQGTTLLDILAMNGIGLEACNMLVYVWQALHGAMSISTDQLDNAIGLSETKISSRSQSSSILLKSYELISSPLILQKQNNWPDLEPWIYLLDDISTRQWLQKLFAGGIMEYKLSLVAYYILLSTREFCFDVGRGENQWNDNDQFVAPYFALWVDKATQDKAYELLRKRDLATLQQELKKLEENTFNLVGLWKNWINASKGRINRFRRDSKAYCAHEDLVNDLLHSA